MFVFNIWPNLNIQPDTQSQIELEPKINPTYFLWRKYFKKGKCVSTNPPSSAFPPFGNWDPYIFVNKIEQKLAFFLYYSSNYFPLFQKFPYIYSERAELGWKRAKMQIQEECNISHKLNAKWNVDRSRINCGITKKKNYYVFFCSKNINKCNYSSCLRWVVENANINFLLLTSHSGCSKVFPSHPDAPLCIPLIIPAIFKVSSNIYWFLASRILSLKHMNGCKQQNKKIIVTLLTKNQWCWVFPCFPPDLKFWFKVSTQFLQTLKVVTLCAHRNEDV